jgi:hypothetical protein
MVREPHPISWREESPPAATGRPMAVFEQIGKVLNLEPENQKMPEKILEKF